MNSPLTFIILIISFFATVPQLQKTISSGSTGDFSFATLFMNILTNALLGVHGYLTRDMGILAIGAWYFIYWLILIAYKLNVVPL